MTLTLLALAVGSFPVSARAENEGQADLDKATQQKLGAQTAGDFTEVIQLCESALKKGLDKGNTAFANDLMASALVQRGSLTANKAYRAILAAGPEAAADDAWKTYRSEALADLEKGLKLSPKQPQAQFEIAKLNLLPGGDPQKAMEALDKTIALADDDAALRAEALVRRATLRSNPRQRLADLDEAVRALPGNAMVLRTRGLVRAEAEKWDAALADFDKAIAADPQAGLDLPNEGPGAGQAQEAAGGACRPGKGPRASPRTTSTCSWPRDRSSSRKSNYKAAAEELTRALAIDGSSLPILELRAALYEQLGEKAKALADVEKILEIKPGQPNIMRMRAVLLADLGKYDAAVEELQNLHKANPKDSLTMLQLGMLYTSMKKYDKAIEVFTAILADHPDDVDAMRGRADALLNLGRRADAVADYERALKLQPHDVGILNNFAWVLATAPEDNLRDGHRALALATDACRQTEYKQDYILSTLAAAYAETGDFDSARKWAAQAVEVKPSEHAEDSTQGRIEEGTPELPGQQALAGGLAGAGRKERRATTEGQPRRKKTARKPHTLRRSKKKNEKPDDADGAPQTVRNAICSLCRGTICWICRTGQAQSHHFLGKFSFATTCSLGKPLLRTLLRESSSGHILSTLLATSSRPAWPTRREGSSSRVRRRARGSSG